MGDKRMNKQFKGMLLFEIMVLYIQWDYITVSLILETIYTCLTLSFHTLDATDHPELEQGQSVIDKQPQPEEVPGIIMNSYDHSPKVPRLIQPPPAVELVEFSNLKQFKGI